MVVYAGIASCEVRILGRSAGFVNAAEELVAFSGSEAVVVIVLPVQLDFHVVVDVVVKTKGIGHALAAHNLLVICSKTGIGIQVHKFDAAAKLYVAPFLAPLYAGELGTGIIVTLLSTEEEVLPIYTASPRKPFQ